MFSTMQKVPKHNITIEAFDGSDIAEQWKVEVLKLGDKKKASVMGRAALRHFLFVLTADQRELIFREELARKSADEEKARKLQKVSAPKLLVRRHPAPKKHGNRDAG